MLDSQADDLIGRNVIIHSIAGITYAGIVRSICGSAGGEELFELGRRNDMAFQRFVYVANRRRQIRIAGSTVNEAAETA